jgi:nucleotide-binding universal stress UspA family protein
MVTPFELNALLVPLDFSPFSEAVFDQAVQLLMGEKRLVFALHVVDPSLAEFAAVHGLGSRDEVLKLMRARAQGELARFQSRAPKGVDVQVILSEGVPFIEIIRKAADFQVGAVVMGKHGAHGTIEKLLFGSTAERVLRGSTRPVIVIPAETALPPAVD